MALMVPKAMPRTPHLDLMSPEKEPRKQLGVNVAELVSTSGSNMNYLDK